MHFRRALLALALACATGAFAYDAAPEPLRARLGLPSVGDGSDGEATASRRVRVKRLGTLANDTVFERERDYRSRLVVAEPGGEVELFG